MEKIPITFEDNGTQYSGHFSRVSGSGTTSSFHLMINNLYFGQLIFTESYGWKFYNNKELFKDKGPEFGAYVETWCQ